MVLAKDNRAAARRRGGFTLIEVIVTVGILALVTVAIAAVFGAVGEVVSSGQRLSNLNRVAARVERVMRQDFDSMIRADAFMVIHNEYASDVSSPNQNAFEDDRLLVPLDASGAGNRWRRIDEILFFARGDFRSKRRPLHPELLAESDAAMIYYGHGQRQIEPQGGFDADDPYYRPFVDDENSDPDARLGAPSSGATINPNEFASDWTLLRHETLLIPEPALPRALPEVILGDGAGGGFRPGSSANDFDVFVDHSRQIAGQPAATSVFQSAARLVRPFDGDLARGENGLGVRDVVPGSASSSWFLTEPLLTSGVVDIATADLATIRADVVSPVLTTGSTQFFVQSLSQPNNLRLDSNVPHARWRGLLGGSLQRRFDAVGFMRRSDMTAEGSGVNPQGNAQIQQRWMIDAMPSNPWDLDSRVRYEPVPPVLVSTDMVFASDTPLTNEDERLERAVRESDLEMLSASVFLARCTEFVVEFSFGITDATGNLVWHGLDRPRADQQDRSVGDSDRQVADVIEFVANNNAPVDADGGGDIDTNSGFFFPAVVRGAGNELSDAVTQAVVWQFNNDVNAYYCFGYGDHGPELASTADDGPWPWPTQVRVTIGFVDETDLTEEAVVQAVFRVPQPDDL